MWRAGPARGIPPQTLSPGHPAEFSPRIPRFSLPEKKSKKNEKFLKKNKISVDTKYILCYIHSHPLTTSGGHKVL
jgi:hypothetical protein